MVLARQRQPPVRRPNPAYLVVVLALEGSLACGAGATGAHVHEASPLEPVVATTRAKFEKQSPADSTLPAHALAPSEKPLVPSGAEADAARAEVNRIREEFESLDLATAYAEAPEDPRLLALSRRLDSMISAHPGLAEALVEHGRIALVLGDAPRALESLKLASSLETRDPEADSALGIAYLATGNVESAVQALERAAALDPTQPERLTNLGTVYMVSGRVSRAIKTYHRALDIAPEDARTHGDLGAAHLADSHPELALPHLLRATELEPQRATFATNLGYAYHQQGQVELAVHHHRRALELDPELGSAWLNLGNAYADLRRYAEARQALERAARLDPSDPRPPNSLSDLEEVVARARSSETRP